MYKEVLFTLILSIFGFLMIWLAARITIALIISVPAFVIVSSYCVIRNIVNKNKRPKR